MGDKRESTELKQAYIAGYIGKDVHLYINDAATKLGIKPIEYIDMALRDYILMQDMGQLDENLAMRRDYIAARREGEDHKMVKELVRWYLRNPTEDRLHRLEKHCDTKGVVLKDIIQDVIRQGEASELYDEADMQMAHALDWARDYFSGKTVVPSKVVEKDAESKGIPLHVLKEVKSTLAIPSRRKGSLVFSWFPLESKTLQDLIDHKTTAVAVLECISSTEVEKLL